MNEDARNWLRCTRHQRLVRSNGFSRCSAPPSPRRAVLYTDFSKSVYRRKTTRKRKIVFTDRTRGFSRPMLAVQDRSHPALGAARKRKRMFGKHPLSERRAA